MTKCSAPGKLLHPAVQGWGAEHKPANSHYERGTNGGRSQAISLSSARWAISASMCVSAAIKAFSVGMALVGRSLSGYSTIAISRATLAAPRGTI